MAFDTHSLVQSLLNKNKAPAPAPAQEEPSKAQAAPMAPAPAKEPAIEDTEPEPAASEPAAGGAGVTEDPAAEVSADADGEELPILPPELMEKVAKAGELMDGSFLPAPKGSKEELSEDEKSEVADLIHAYFEADDPELRDNIIILLSASPAEDAEEFFLTALEEDPDPFVHSAAAEALYRRGRQEGAAALYEVLETPEVIEQMNHAITVLAKSEGMKLAPKLINIWNDAGHSSEEHIEALLGLEQIMGRGLESMLISFIEGIKGSADMPEDEFLEALNVLERLDSAKAPPVLESLKKRLLASVSDKDDILPLMEEIDGTIGLLS